MTVNHKLIIRPVTGDDYGWITTMMAEHWGSTRIVSRGRIHQADRLPAFIAELNGQSVGLLTYYINDDACEVVSLNSLVGGIGIGSALLKAVYRAAKASGCRRLWLITTNDNLKALRFYQKRGFALVTVHRGALSESRRLKPGIPEVGRGGIPLRDEIELEMLIE